MRSCALFVILSSSEPEEMSGQTVITLFIAVLLVGTVASILAAKFLLPRFGDAVSSFFFSMGGRATAEDMVATENRKAAALVAAGDYKGAIAEYEQTLKQRPEDLRAIAEIARIRAESLNEPDTALAFLQEQMASRIWDAEGEGFILFRIAGIHRKVQHDKVKAREALEQVMSRLPKTRHSANARAQLDEWQREDIREETMRRQKASLNRAS